MPYCYIVIEIWRYLSMKVRFWGVRGSIASPLIAQDIRDKLEKILQSITPKDIVDDQAKKHFIEALPYSLTGTYGSNTTCVELRSLQNDLIIIDAGTGLRPLGNELMKSEYAKGDGEASMIFTHTHWDHIQGLPFFVPFYIEGNSFHIHAIHKNIEGRLRYQHKSEFFPITFDQMPASKCFYQHEVEDIWELYGIKISQKPLRHPGISYAFRFEENGKIFTFCTDAEFSFSNLTTKKDTSSVNKDANSMLIDEYVEYFWGADVLVFDTQYTFEDQIQKIDWGHSSSLMAVDIAMKANVKKLVLFHYDPSYNDEKIEQIYLRAMEYKELLTKELLEKKENKYVDLEIMTAREGLELDI